MKTVLVIVGVVLILLLSGLIWLLFAKKKHNKRVAITTSDGIDLGEYVTIGGIQQFLYHRGENINNPVILFLHGGPGSPMLPFVQDFQLPWEKHLTVVHWEQRNSGKTFYKNDPSKVAPTTTIDQLVADTHEIVLYLKQKYGKDKIWIVGHSWGSILGSLFVHRHPQSVQGYIGVGQVVDMFENEQIGFDKALECITAANCDKDIQTLQLLKPYPVRKFDSEMKNKLSKLRKVQGKYKLAASPTAKLVYSAITSPFYSIKDMRYMILADIDGINHGQQLIFQELFETFDLKSVTTDYQVPMFYIHGTRDWQTPYSIVEKYYASVVAPQKGFYPILDAGHATMLDKPLDFSNALLSIIRKVDEEVR